MHILQAEPLQDYNSLALTGEAAALLRVTDEADLVQALAWAAGRGLAVVPIGEGSNVVIAGDVDALVLRIETRGIELLQDLGDTVVLRVAAGENWHQFVEWSLQQGFFGLENLALIPGTVGAAPIQNIGAYGVELGPRVRQVHCLSIADGTARSLTANACCFAYRDSIFKHQLQDQLVITAVELELTRQPDVKVAYPGLTQLLEQKGISTPTPQAVFDAVVEIRRSKLPDPSTLPNAGSFFKNPVVASEVAKDLATRFSGLPLYPQSDGTTKLSAGWLIDQCGWKGYQRDGLGVHPDHALVLVNYGQGRGAALLSLAAEIASSVVDCFDIALEIEPRIYGGSV